MTREGLSEATEKLQEYKQQNPNASKEDLIKTMAGNREAIRQRLVNVLTPEQLTKWDAAVSRAKELLGAEDCSMIYILIRPIRQKQ